MSYPPQPEGSPSGPEGPTAAQPQPPYPGAYPSQAAPPPPPPPPGGYPPQMMYSPQQVEGDKTAQMGLVFGTMFLTFLGLMSSV